MQIVVDTIDFFANCDDSLVNPDVAVNQLEQIANHLQDLSDEEQDEFKAFVTSLASKTKRRNREKADFYASIPENIGLV